MQIYQGYIRKDDADIINSAKFIYRKYKFNYSLKLRSKLYLWREQTIKLQVLSLKGMMERERNKEIKYNNSSDNNNSQKYYENDRSDFEEEDKTRRLEVEISKTSNNNNNISNSYIENKKKSILKEEEQKGVNDINNLNKINDDISTITNKARIVKKSNNNFIINTKSRSKSNPSKQKNTNTSNNANNTSKVKFNNNNSKIKANNSNILSHKPSSSRSPQNSYNTKYKFNKENNKQKTLINNNSINNISTIKQNSNIYINNINKANDSQNNKNDNDLNASFLKIQEEFIKNQNNFKLNYDYSQLDESKYLENENNDNFEYNDNNENNENNEYGSKTNRTLQLPNKNRTYSPINESLLKNNNEEFSDYNTVHQGDLYLSEEQKFYNLKKAEKNNDIFNRLYVDAFKKKDNVLYNEEMREVKELKECTFIPKINK